jgi:hypothetical protein
LGTLVWPWDARSWGNPWVCIEWAIEEFTRTNCVPGEVLVQKSIWHQIG